MYNSDNELITKLLTNGFTQFDTSNPYKKIFKHPRRGVFSIHFDHKEIKIKNNIIFIESYRYISELQLKNILYYTTLATNEAKLIRDYIGDKFTYLNLGIDALRKEIARKTELNVLKKSDLKVMRIISEYDNFQPL